VPHEIRSARLRLPTLGPDVLRAWLAGATDETAARLGARVPERWDEMLPVFRLRLEQLEREPGYEPWLTRAVVLEREARVVGIAGFHGPPGGDWLREHAPGGVEFGYTILPADRRRGYALEASAALIAWAVEQGVRAFVLSIAPENRASLGVAAKLGFERAGEWTHPERGRELVFRRVLAP
jgi:RimJ/RimL family protein N-acetyltransferase